MEFGSGAGGGSGDDNHDVLDPHRRKKRYHRHTANQIQKLEGYTNIKLYFTSTVNGYFRYFLLLTS